tara:strand:- start:5674 stop:6924 length:1251 start_codon:yes stop_codon:yes gene_type:complete
MIENFQFNSKQIDKINNISSEEKNFRIKNLKRFQTTGFPNKKLEDWKFSDFNNIISSNFKKLNIKSLSTKKVKINLLKDFEHNYIYLVNGSFYSSNFKHEDESKIKISSYDKSIDNETYKNPLVFLNHAFADNGFSLEVKDNYKFKKTLIIYNTFTNDTKDKIINSKNKIEISENSEVHIIDYTINKSKYKFVNNCFENLIVRKNSKFRNLIIQNNKSNGIFHKFVKNKLFNNSDYSNFIFSSGLKFNKFDIECDLLGEGINCSIFSGLFLNKNEHQEIKTRINHMFPNSKSFQKIKNVLNSESKGIFQGKIFVKDIAQKTDAYQLSKALLLDENSEFNSKPELEIYADDVKCTHGSASGSIDENSLHYLMTRGLNKKAASKLLVKGFLNDIIEFIKSSSIKKFIENKLEEQLNGY